MVEKFTGHGETEKAPEQEQIPEKKIEKKSEARTFEDFGISQEELESIEGYRLLSEGQRLLVLEHLQQLTLGRIQDEAQVKYGKRTAEAKFFGKVWQGISKQYQIAKLEKAINKAIDKIELWGNVTEAQEIIKQALTKGKGGK
ncbi:hypothetical protein LCGC14_2550760 [marine sediment metagenome]|uniref:Uncharacterized protein n=1 Tax=marine sediment metagenome TaxID=412755 RepID=A0A0F9BAU4_9ZZZZ